MDAICKSNGSSKCRKLESWSGKNEREKKVCLSPCAHLRAEAKRLSFTIEGKIPEKQYSEDTLAGRVNKLRAEKKMTQKELAEKCNTSPST